MSLAPIPPPPVRLDVSPDATVEDLRRLTTALHQAGYTYEEAALAIGNLFPERRPQRPAPRPLPAWPAPPSLLTAWLLGAATAATVGGLAGLVWLWWRSAP